MNRRNKTSRNKSLLLGALNVAVSSSPRPWMDVFALPEKSNMAVTESDPHPKVQKMSITFKWLCDLWAEHAGMWLKCYWFLKKIYFWPDYSPIFSDITVQRYVPWFCTRSICGWNLFQPLGLLWTVNFKALHCKDFASVATCGDHSSLCTELYGANDASQTPALKWERVYRCWRG